MAIIDAMVRLTMRNLITIIPTVKVVWVHQDLDTNSALVGNSTRMRTVFDRSLDEPPDWNGCMRDCWNVVGDERLSRTPGRSVKSLTTGLYSS